VKHAAPAPRPSARAAAPLSVRAIAPLPLCPATPALLLADMPAPTRADAQAPARVDAPAAVRVDRDAARERQAAHSGRAWLVAGAIALAGSAALFASHRPSRPDELASIDAVPDAPVAPTPVASIGRTEAPAHVQSQAVAAAPIPAKVAPVNDVAPRKRAEPETARQPVVAAAGFAPPVAAAAVPPAPAVEKASTPAAEPVSDAPAVAPIAISGCLVRDDDAFVLKNTSGADVPTSRSWKSGFLKKRSVTIALVDATGTLKLQRYVGQRVTATGTLANREMHPRSVRSVSASCD
jgi:hypothetical protein